MARPNDYFPTYYDEDGNLYPMWQRGLHTEQPAQWKRRLGLPQPPDLPAEPQPPDLPAEPMK